MTELSTSYNGALVVLSVTIAIVSSFVALTAVPRIHATGVSGCRANLWSLAFGVSMGVGVWSMHFIGMLALKLPVPVRYDLSLTLISLGVGAGFTTLGVLPLRRGGDLKGLRLPGVGTLMGLGIAGMHYTGMAAMRMPASISYDGWIVALSVLIAVAASSAALWIANRLRMTGVFSDMGIKAAAAVIMGLAVSAMHYTGMAAANFYALPGVIGPQAGLDTHLMVIALSVIATLVQGGVLVMAALDESNVAARKELALRSHMRSLLNAIPDAIFSINDKGVIQHANPAAARLFGYALEELRRLDLHTLAPDDIHPSHLQWVADKMPGKHHDMINRRREIQGRRRDGTVFPCELSVSEFREDHQRRFSVVVRDISKRRQAEAEIERLRIAVEQTPEGIFITDHEGRIVYANPAVATMTGVAPDQLIGRLAAEIRGGKKDDVTYRKIFSRLNQGQSWHGDIEFVHADGVRHAIDRSIAPVLEAGQVRYHVCVDTDVTEQRQAQSKIEHTQRLESLGVLAGGIAHDFNNILTAIMGNAALGRMKLDVANPVSEHLARIEESSQRAAELCKQMLAYSGKGRFLAKAINLSDMVKDITKLLGVSIARNVILKFHLAENLPTVEADVAQLQQVVLNLITNANEAIGSKSGVISFSTGVMHVDDAYLATTISPETLPVGRYVFMEVSDTGCGMDAETIQKIFDPFFTTKFTGRGLGMSAVLGIVRGHSGALRVYSEPGKGTTFKLLLPVLEDFDETGNGPEDVAPAGKASGAVLVVDDEETVLRVIGDTHPPGSTAGTI